MDLFNIAFTHDATTRALLGARLDDPVVPDSRPVRRYRGEGKIDSVLPARSSSSRSA
jgi:hypothetical protein